MANVLRALLICAVLAVVVLQARGKLHGPVARVARAAAVAVVLFVALVVLMQNRLIYPRTRTPLMSWDPPADAEACAFTTEDGLTLHGWFHAGYGETPAEERPVVLWCHGNAGNITHRAENLLLLARSGLAVFIFDYRGYGQSDGKPSEKGLYFDADAAYAHLTDERGIPPDRIIAFGRSLGAGVALDLALRRPVAGLIMESAFRSIPAMASVQFPVLPLGPLVRSRFDNEARIGGLGVPLLMLHGDRDEIVPFEQGRAVFDSAPAPKTWYTISGAGHNDTYAAGGREYLDAFASFCRECVRQPDADAASPTAQP